jgi:3-carboxy-cis,cis-muconate cycloisomerase
MALLEPGAHRAADAVTDEALVAAMLRVETAWIDALVQQGSASREHADAVAAVTAPVLDPVAVEAAGNPVLPLVRALRDEVDAGTASVVHVGLTSQDVLDSALMLLAADARASIDVSLARVGDALAALAEEHRGSLKAGRTLTQHAVPVTLGLTAAQWLVGVVEAREALAGVVLPVQCGGAVGTLARAAAVVPDPVSAAAHLADVLGLAVADLPWHTRRTPVTRLGDALAEICQALGVLAADVLVLGRPEIGEVSEGAVSGRGGSSTMPHKQNPVLAVLVRSAALRAPHLTASLHAAAGEQSDQRAAGPWHAEWPALRDLLRLTVVAADQAAELAEGLAVHADVMAARARERADVLLAEAGGGDDPGSYLGATDAFIDAALRLHRKGHDD